MTPPSCFYFAYGSNMDPERFRARVGEWKSLRQAWLEDYELRFAESVRSEGGGGAVVDAAPGSTVAGVLFEITDEQLAAMDREEFAPHRDQVGAGRRLSVIVNTEGGQVGAELYTVVDDGGRCAPSEAYLGHILRGLEHAEHAPDAIEAVRRVARG
jgi:hypothetical protein